MYVVEYYPLYQLPLLSVHIYPFVSTLPANYPRVVTFLVLICVSTQRNNRAESVSPLISGG